MDDWEGESTCNSFREKFYKNLSKVRHFKKAYEITEQEHERHYNKRKYSGVESFHSQLSKAKKKR